MAFRFQESLIDLLPGIYRQSDETGELRTFLQIPAVTLDEIKGLIDRLPGIIDVESCEERFLPLLGSVVGYQYDPLVSAERQRTKFREAIESYRRKGSVRAIYHDLVDQGFQGKVEETFRKAIRLNRRSTLGSTKLPGEVFSLGVYRIVSHRLNDNLRPLLDFHHPAGTKRLIWQWQSSYLPMPDHESATNRIIHTNCPADLDEKIKINRNVLNSGFRLAPKGKAWVLWSAS